MKSFSNNQAGIRRKSLQILLITSGVLLAWAFSLFRDDVILTSQYILTIILFLLISGLLWLGNTTINKFLNRAIPLLTFGTTRFFTQLAMVLAYSLIVINGSYYSFKTIFTVDPPTTSQILVANVYGGIIILIVTSIYFGISFLQSWKKSAVEGERIQKEHIRTQLKALQNHLDPHFLFNNLNVLSSLIHIDRNQSKLFFDHFAEVYRGLLRKDIEDIIPLKEEI